MKFIYIASAYTKGDAALNVRANLLAANAIAAKGFVPFAPLLYHFWHLITPQPYEFWTKLDFAWIDRCDALIRLPGESSGADAEVLYARKLKLPVFCCVEEFLEKYPELCRRCDEYDVVHNHRCPEHPDHDPTPD